MIVENNNIEACGSVTITMITSIPIHIENNIIAKWS